MTEIARGLAGIAITETRLSGVDGEAGELVIGGFALEDLAPNASFEETLFLLWNDRLPSARELEALRADLAVRRDLAPATLAVLRAAAAVSAQPMDALRMATATLGLSDDALHATSLQAEPAAANQRRAMRLVAALPTAVAASHRLSQGLDPIAPDARLSHAANYLAMLEGTRPEPAAARAIERYLISTIDHGFNASTFTARVVASTGADVAACVVAALGALSGPLHGGAPSRALDTLDAIGTPWAAGALSRA